MKGSDVMKPGPTWFKVTPWRGKGVPCGVWQRHGIHRKRCFRRLRKQYSKEDAEEFMRIVDKISRGGCRYMAKNVFKGIRILSSGH